jgi:hypothetical protein
MRDLRCLPAGLLSVAGGLVVAVGAALAVTAGATPAAAAPPFGATLTLDPPSGKSSTTIAATFQITAPDNVRCRMRVVFRWDDHTLGQKSADSCTLTVHIRAPHDGRDQGPHVITAVDLFTRLDATATYTIGNGDATANPTPTTRATQPTDTQSVDAGPPLPVDSATVNPAAAAPAVPQVKTSSSAFSSVALIFGGLLLLGGVVILVLVIMRMRRGEAEPDDYPDDEPLPMPVTAPLGGYPTRRYSYGAPGRVPERAAERTQVLGAERTGTLAPEPTRVLGYPRPPAAPY